ncbi:MAG: SRPBCC family protein [Dehalococcoidia bacterium]
MTDTTLADTFTVTLPSDTEVLMTRIFDAPPRMVWDAYTKPELVRQWLLGPDGWDMPVCDIDLRVGGSYAYRWAHPEQGAFGSGGEFLEVDPTSRLVSTERMEGFDGESHVVITFEEAASGRTLFSMLQRFESKEARDGAVATGMADGVAVSFNRLDAVLGSLA